MVERCVVKQGDAIMVNLAPFIGSAQRSKESVPCLVVAVEGGDVQVRTRHPFRDISLRVQSDWIDAGLDHNVTEVERAGLAVT